MFSLELWNPKRTLETPAEFDALVSRLFSESNFWTPSTDIVETENELRLSLDVPGMKKEDIKIELPGNNTLKIQGERKFETQEGAKVARQERFHGNFTRTFALPNTVDVSKISASYQDGILEIVVPKAETAKPRKIEVSVK